MQMSQRRNKSDNNCDELSDALLDALGAAVVVLDTQGKIVRFNRAAEEITGYKFVELKGQAIWDWLIPPEAQISVRGVFDSLLFDKLIGRFENEWLTKHGARRLFRWRNTVLRASGGTVSHVVAIGEDITEQRKLEHESRERSERLALALQAAKLATWDSDVRTGLITFDARWAAMLGHDAAETTLPFPEWVMHLHPDDRDRVLAEIKAHDDGDTPNVLVNYRMRHKSGHWVWIQAHGRVMQRDSDSQPVRVAGTARDITATKRISDEGINLIQRIEQMMRAVISAQDTERSDNLQQVIPVKDDLPKRQRQILVMIAKGMTSAQIGEKLGITTATVVSHRRALMHKLDLHSTAEVTQFAMSRGLLSGPHV